MYFLEIPREVINAGVLPHLDWNDLLRLRRVCSWTKGITDAYLQVNPDLAPEIEINEGTEKTFEAFMALGIPTTKLFLNNQSGYSFYEKIGRTTEHQFLENYGPLIKHLRVTHLHFAVFGREMDFINGLKNLKSFEASYSNRRGSDGLSAVPITLYNQAVSQKGFYVKDRMLPPSFTSLESIKIGQDYQFVRTVNIVDRNADIFHSCPQLKYVSLPFDSTFKVAGGSGDEALLRESLPRAIKDLQRYIDERPNEFYPSDTILPLEYYDFKNFHHANVPWTMESSLESYNKLPVCWLGSKMFLLVCSRALETGLKLLNVNPIWYCARLHLAEQNQLFSSPELGTPVVSLVGLDPCVMQLNLPNLEKITIPLTSGCVSGLEARPAWPALKSLDIAVDGKEGNVWDVVGVTRFRDIGRVVDQTTSLLFKFFFGNGIVRSNMSELSIGFVEGKVKNEVALPKVEEIIESCPNLKKIKLVNWLGKNKALIKLWEGLPKLEEIWLEGCREVGNVTFVGENKERPVLFKLKNLKKLTLKGLADMPKITDLLFEMVLAKMKLKELVLISDSPVDNVTKAGLEALLRGSFNESIEKFPFKGWSLAGVSAEEFEEFGKKFRSYKML